MGERKILTVILGSPRKNGNSEMLGQALAAGAEENGCEVRWVRTASLKLNGCVDCRHCWSTGRPCVQKDDMEKVYADIEPADIVAFAAPLYFYTWPAQIKPVFDRLLPFYSKLSPTDLRGKKTVLLSVCGDDSPDAFEGLRATYRIAINYLKWENAGEICAYGAYTRGEIAEKGVLWLEEARELGRKL